MNLNHLSYFTEACKEENITKAAENCHVSQPSVTAAIKELEKELGYKLFHRVNNRIFLTEEGFRFHELTKKFLTDFENYYAEACDIGISPKATIRLGVPSVLGTILLKKLIPSFEQKYPKVSLQTYEVPTITGIEMLNKSKLDFLIGVNDGQQQYRSCTPKHIFKIDYVLAVSKKNPLAKETVICPEMLNEQPFVLISKGSYTYQAIKTQFAEYPLNVKLQSSQLSTIEYMVANDHAATIVYKDIFNDNPAIRSVPMSIPFYANVTLFWQRHIYLSSAMRKFISYMEELSL